MGNISNPMWLTLKLIPFFPFQTHISCNEDTRDLSFHEIYQANLSQKNDNSYRRF